MKLIHYSNKPLAKVMSVRQITNPGYKPLGLWVSVEGEDDWRNWCEAEGYGLPRLACGTEVVLAPDAKIIRLAGAADIYRFHGKYIKKPGRGMRYSKGIKWFDVARRFDGIIIAPYVWECRLEGAASSWYYGWDCASGCIWNKRAVADLRPVQNQAAA